MSLQVETTPDAKAAGTRAQRTKKWVKIGAAVVVVLGSVEVGYWFHQRAEDQRVAQETKRAAKIAADASKSKDYAAARAQFVAGNFDPATIKAAVRDEFRRQALIRTDGYFDQKTPETRLAYVDKVIDEMSTYRKTVAVFRPASTQPASPEWKVSVVEWAISQPPVTRAKMAEFSVALNARCAQRGLPRMDDAAP